MTFKRNATGQNRQAKAYRTQSGVSCDRKKKKNSEFLKRRDHMLSASRTWLYLSAYSMRSGLVEPTPGSTRGRWLASLQDSLAGIDSETNHLPIQHLPFSSSLSHHATPDERPINTRSSCASKAKLEIITGKLRQTMAHCVLHCRRVDGRDSAAPPPRSHTLSSIDLHLLT